MILFHASSLFSQTIKGKIINNDTGEAIPFSTVAIQGTTIGEPSDFNGNFKIFIPGKNLSGNIIVSCVGFKKDTVKISSIINTDEVVFKLKANSIIDEIVVTDKSLFSHKIIKNAVANIQKNYLNSAFNYDITYTNDKELNNGKTMNRELNILLYDKKGYKRTNTYDVFKSVGYKFIKSKRNFKQLLPSQAIVNFDDIIEFDIIRNPGNILDTLHINSFEIDIEKEKLFGNDSVWVINYTCKKPNFINTSDMYAYSYSGKLYVKKNNFAVLYNETSVKSANISEFGKQIYITDKKDANKIKLSDYKFSVSYKFVKGKYSLDKISYTSSFKYSKEADNNVIKNNSTLTVKNTAQNNLEKVLSRKYFDDL